jgi:hypothetical protein
MQKPTAITSTPHFFSERSLASRADLTTGGGGTDAEGGNGTTLALSVAWSFLLIASSSRDSMSTKIMLEIPRNNELSLVLKDPAAGSGMTFTGWAPMAWEPVVTYQYPRLTDRMHST